MDTAWINAWLAYVHYSKGISPRPGPINNNVLITADHENKRWVAKDGLIMASGKRAADYRRVSKACWEVMNLYYPKSGPVITSKFTPGDPASLTGLYDTSVWVIKREYVEAPSKKKKKRDIPDGRGLSIEDSMGLGIKMGDIKVDDKLQPIAANGKDQSSDATVPQTHIDDQMVEDLLFS